ncbi:MAG: hypothetical protein Q9171_001309 [Xanthocarpia ochracea]
MIFQILISCLLTTIVVAANEVPTFLNGPFKPFSKPQLVDDDDQRFRARTIMSGTKLSATPVLMNAVELAARYAEMDFLSQVRQRQGIVLPQFPQVEIAVVPAPPARRIEVRLIIYTLYAVILDMILGQRFNECEVEVFWDNQVKAYIYFTEPSDDSLSPRDHIKRRASSPSSNNTTVPQELTNTTAQLTDASFDWRPIYKPNARNLRPNDVFLLALGAIKVIAPFAGSEKVLGAFHVGSTMVDAHLQIFLHNRRIPRTSPPFFRYSDVLDAVRRIPGWELAHHRFAEFFCSIEVSRRPVGSIMMEKGKFTHPLGGNVSSS